MSAGAQDAAGPAEDAKTATTLPLDRGGRSALRLFFDCSSVVLQFEVLSG
jgi:hypothetical protein